MNNWFLVFPISISAVWLTMLYHLHNHFIFLFENSQWLHIGIIHNKIQTETNTPSTVLLYYKDTCYLEWGKLFSLSLFHDVSGSPWVYCLL